MASSVPSSATTLSDIFNVDADVLQTKFHLEPRHRYDPHGRDNKVFFSPTVLLEDRQLHEGGWKDWGASKVLGVLAKHILTSKDIRLFQVPEITHFKMGYGKKSENKHNLAIKESEAKHWMTFFDFAKWKANMPFRNSGDSTQEEGPIPMDIDPEFTFPTQEDTQALEYSEDVIDPESGGLKIQGVKSRYLLFFSILLVFYKKKIEPPAKEANIGENKISDFLLFWIVPYLLHFTEQQVNTVNKHHEAESKKKGSPRFRIQSVKKSANDILLDAFKKCKISAELKQTLLNMYINLYSEDVLEHIYELPAVTSASGTVEPIVLVPLRYQVTKMTVEMEDIGQRWREIGNVHLVDQFVDKFVQSKSIQEDFLGAIEEQEEKEQFAVDYGILLPDEATFSELMREIEEKHHGVFRRYKCFKKQGRYHATPRLGLVMNGKGTLSVSFSYFQGKHFLNCPIQSNQKPNSYMGCPQGRLHQNLGQVSFFVFLHHTEVTKCDKKIN